MLNGFRERSAYATDDGTVVLITIAAKVVRLRLKGLDPSKYLRVSEELIVTVDANGAIHLFDREGKPLCLFCRHGRLKSLVNPQISEWWNR